MTVFYIVVSILLLGILITVHEAGHFALAKAFGFPVDEFSIGMGPKLLQKVKNGTKYTLRAIPMGGYVAFESIDDAQAEELVFQQQPLWQRFLVLFAGPGMNIVLAVVMVTALLALQGTAVAVPRVASVMENTPAVEAGIEAGDTFLAINGIEIGGNYEKLTQILDAYEGGELTLLMERDGVPVTLTLMPAYLEAEDRYQIGVYMDNEYQPYPLGTAIKMGFVDVKNMVVELLRYLVQMVSGKASTNDVAGVVGTVAMVAQTGTQYGFTTVLYMFAFISVNLGVMNLLPLPALDGGKILLLGVELLRGKPIDPKYEGWISMVGLAAFGILFVLITYQDIARIITGG